MLQPPPQTASPPASQNHAPVAAPVPVRAIAPQRPVPNPFLKPWLLPDSDPQPDDTLTEEAGMARNPAALGAYAGSF